MRLLDLRLLSETENLDSSSALEKFRDATIETFLHHLARLPLEDHHLIRIDLGRRFRLAIQSPPKRQPHGIRSIIRTAKNSRVVSTEAKLFGLGGTRAVVAYAIAGKRDSKVVELVQSLSHDELEAMLESLAHVNDDRHFTRLLHTLEDGSDDDASTEEKHVPGPRYGKRRRLKAEGPPGNAKRVYTRVRYPAMKNSKTEPSAATTQDHPSPLGSHSLQRPGMWQTEASRTQRVSDDRKDQMEREMVPSATRDGQEPIYPRDRFDDTITLPSHDSWSQRPLIGQTETAVPAEFAEIHNLFQSETIMVPNFDEPYPTGGTTAATGELVHFDASQIMTANFDSWAMETNES
jgi:hypothetical protein